APSPQRPTIVDSAGASNLYPNSTSFESNFVNSHIVREIADRSVENLSCKPENREVPPRPPLRRKSKSSLGRSRISVANNISNAAAADIATTLASYAETDGRVIIQDLPPDIYNLAKSLVLDWD